MQLQQGGEANRMMLKMKNLQRNRILWPTLMRQRKRGQGMHLGRWQGLMKTIPSLQRLQLNETHQQHQQQQQQQQQ